MHEITKETFTDIKDISTKVDILFDICTNMCRSLDRLEKAQKRKIWYDRFCATFGGTIGGIGTVLGFKILK